MGFPQWWILGTSIFGIFFTQQIWWPNTMKYAPVFGLLGQPAWLFETYTNNQPGMFVICIVYTGIWLLGFYNYWVLPRRH